MRRFRRQTSAIREGSKGNDQHTNTSAARKTNYEGLFEGKSVLITGGGSGIGRETALAFARQGATVTIADISITDGEETVDVIEREHGTAMFCKADVSRESDVKNLIKFVVDACSSVDIAFNNAGAAAALIPTAEQSEAHFEKLIAVDLKGVWLCMKHEINQMLKQTGRHSGAKDLQGEERGCIVNMSSSAAFNRYPGSSLWTACKQGVLGLTESAAQEYSKHGIRINTVCPGFIRTAAFEQQMSQYASKIVWDPTAKIVLLRDGNVPLGRIGEPQDVANAVLWLCSSLSSYIVGQGLNVDGGNIVR